MWLSGRMKNLYIAEIRAAEKPDVDLSAYPFSLPIFRHLTRLRLTSPVTFFIGENGTGKSTLMEAIAVNYGFNAEGGTKNFSFATRETHSDLHRHIIVGKGVTRAKDGFFLRAESFYNVASEIDRLDVIDAYGGVSLHKQSHGESFLALMLNRFRGHGLYLLDEPGNLESSVSAKLRVKNDSTVLTTKDITLSAGDVPVSDLTWDTALPSTLASEDYTLTWELSLNGGGSYATIATTKTRFFVVCAQPTQSNSFGSPNRLTCKRISEILKRTGAIVHVGTIAERVQQWRDSAKIDTSDNTTGGDGTKLWALLDGVGKGQCGEGALLMEQAMLLLGISAKYQHVLPALFSFDVPIRTAISPNTPAPTRSHHGTETLMLYSMSSGALAGWNVGEGCCLVGGKLYSAFAGGIIGEVDGVVNGNIAASAAHHILLQLEANATRQRWQKEDTDPCDDGGWQPVP